MDDASVYVMLVGIVCLVVSWFVKEPETSARLAKDIEEAMDLVAADLEEENKALLESMAGMKQEYERQADGMNGRIGQLEKRVAELSAQMRLLLDLRRHPETQAGENPKRTSGGEGKQEAASQTAAEAPASAPNFTQDTPEAEPVPAVAQAGMKERYAALFKLHGQGKSVEQIAKKLDMNKGEVSLIIQLAKQEEAGRA